MSKLQENSSLMTSPVKVTLFSGAAVVNYKKLNKVKDECNIARSALEASVNLPAVYVFFFTNTITGHMTSMTLLTSLIYSIMCTAGFPSPVLQDPHRQSAFLLPLSYLLELEQKHEPSVVCGSLRTRLGRQWCTEFGKVKKTLLRQKMIDWMLFMSYVGMQQSYQNIGQLQTFSPLIDLAMYGAVMAIHAYVQYS